MRAIQVDVWSDIACPWCWIGKRRLEQASKLVDIDFRVEFHAFQLNPSAPRSIQGDADYVGRLAAKYRCPRPQAQQMIDNMTAAGAEEGLQFDFSKVVPVNTFDAHRVIALAKTKGLQLEAKERLMRGYFAEGLALSEVSVLAELGVDVGLDPDEVIATLSSDSLSDAVREDLGMAARLQITGVPFFLFNGKLAVPGAQPPETLAKAAEKAAEKDRTFSANEGAACGAEDCE
jgi:predicted DsbA family dithiol-disulfide isomerase